MGQTTPLRNLTMDVFKNKHSIGPGGWKCPCCGPAPKHRAKARRVARARFQVETRRLANEEG